ncbi:MAG: hypothetical protein R2726_14110 [Acidimicrobiales bacterium]
MVLLPEPEPWRGDATAGHPWAAVLVAAVLGDAEPDALEAAALLDRADEEFRSQGDQVGAATVCFVRGLRCGREGRYRAAVQWWNQCLAAGGDAVRTPQLLSFLSLESYLAGDLAAALCRIEDAFGEAVEVGSDREAARALLYLSMFAFTKGDLRRVERLLEQAAARFEQAEETNRPEGLPILVSLQGQLAGLRGDLDAARRLFDRADRLSVELATPWYDRILVARRAETMALQHDSHDIEELRRRLDDLPPAAADTSTEGIIERSKGMAATAAADPDAAEAHLRRALAMPASRVEHVRAKLALGELLVAFGDLHEATEVLRATQQELVAAGATYWQARCLWFLAKADPEHAARWEAMARTFDDGDVAYRVLFAPPGGMRISLVDGPAVEIGGRPVTFATRNAELTVVALALAGPAGLAADDLAACLWADAAPGRLRPRLRTMLWHIRTALGSESWRLTRRDDRLVLDLAGAVVQTGDGDRPVGADHRELRRIIETLLPDLA